MVMKSERAYTSAELSARSAPSSLKRSDATKASKASTFMSKPRARWATSWPIRPKPRIPRVFS
jgi:hypothetical protein